MEQGLILSVSVLSGRAVWLQQFLRRDVQGSSRRNRSYFGWRRSKDGNHRAEHSWLNGKTGRSKINVR